MDEQQDAEAYVRTRVFAARAEICRLLAMLDCVETDLQWFVQEWEKDRDTSIQFRRFTVRAGGHAFFGLRTGYFIWGGQALFGFPKTSPEVARTMGMWGSGCRA